MAPRISTIAIGLCLAVGFTETAGKCPPDGSYAPDKFCSVPLCAFLFAEEDCTEDYQPIPDGASWDYLSLNATGRTYKPGTFCDWKKNWKDTQENCNSDHKCDARMYSEMEWWPQGFHWGNEVETVVVKEGCTLELFEKMNFNEVEGKKRTHSSTTPSTLGELKHNIGSLKCSCRSD